MSLVLIKALGYGTHVSRTFDPVRLTAARKKLKGTSLLTFCDWAKEREDQLFPLLQREFPEEQFCRLAFQLSFGYPITNFTPDLLGQTLEQTVHFEPNESDIFLLVPPTMVDEWVRVDDEMDRFEEQEDVARYKTLPRKGMRPFNTHLVQKTGEHRRIVKNNEYEAILRREHEIDVDAAFLNQFRAVVSLDVIALVVFMECFDDPAEFIDQLRPTLYAYWRES